MEGVETNAEMESILSGKFDHALVSSNAGSFESFAGNLLLLQRQQMDASGKVVDGRLLRADIVDADFGVGNTSAKTRLDVRLVFLVPVALGRSCFEERMFTLWKKMCEKCVLTSSHLELLFGGRTGKDKVSAKIRMENDMNDDNGIRKA